MRSSSASSKSSNVHVTLPLPGQARVTDTRNWLFVFQHFDPNCFPFCALKFALTRACFRANVSDGAIQGQTSESGPPGYNPGSPPRRHSETDDAPGSASPSVVMPCSESQCQCGFFKMQARIFVREGFVRKFTQCNPFRVTFRRSGNSTIFDESVEIFCSLS